MVDNFPVEMAGPMRENKDLLRAIGYKARSERNRGATQLTHVERASTAEYSIIVEARKITDTRPMQTTEFRVSVVVCRLGVFYGEVRFGESAQEVAKWVNSWDTSDLSEGVVRAAGYIEALPPVEEKYPGEFDEPLVKLEPYTEKT
jgi:hypothetical protein